MDSDGINRWVAALESTKTVEQDEAWSQLRPLGVAVLPYFLAHYQRMRKWQGRVTLLYHATKYARVSDDAYKLGVLGLADRATLVRYRACGLLAYSLRRDAISHLQMLVGHSDEQTANDAIAAIDAIERRNHHFFRDRQHTGRIFWEVTPV